MSLASYLRISGKWFPTLYGFRPEFGSMVTKLEEVRAGRLSQRSSQGHKGWLRDDQGKNNSPVPGRMALLSLLGPPG